MTLNIRTWNWATCFSRRLTTPPLKPSSRYRSQGNLIQSQLLTDCNGPTREIWYSPIYLLIVMVPTREIWLTDCNISTREWFCSPPKPAEWNAFGILSTLHWHFNDFSRPIRACHPPHFATLRVVPTASPAFLPSSPLPSLSLRLW